MSGRTHRHSLELTGKGDVASGGFHGLTLPLTNLTDPNTSGQISYAEGSGIVTNSPIKISHVDILPAALSVTSNKAAISQSVAIITQDNTTGGQACLELNQDDTNVVPIKITDAAGSCLVDGLQTPSSGTAMADFGMIITIGASDYAIPVLPH